MFRKFVALFFLSVFIGYTSLPTVISVLDTDIDISLFIDVNEEESKEKETSKDLEIEIMEIKNADLNFNNLKTLVLAGHYLNNYSKPQLNMVSPPPEFSNIL